MKTSLLILLALVFVAVSVVAFFAILGAVAWASERAARRRTAAAQVRRHGGVE